MEILLHQAGKKFHKEWIFRNTSLSFLADQKSVILGPNGSGKSTFLQVIAGSILPNEGSVHYKNASTAIPEDDFFRYVSFASPYLELIEEFTLDEIISFHFKFKSIIPAVSEKDLMDVIGLKKESKKILKYFSSGMKQRVKLGLAFLSDTPILILDEPCSNLDNAGVAWYKNMAEEFTKERIVIVASNQFASEYEYCDRELNIMDYKK